MFSMRYASCRILAIIHITRQINIRKNAILFEALNLFYLRVVGESNTAIMKKIVLFITFLLLCHGISSCTKCTNNIKYNAIPSYELNYDQGKYRLGGSNVKTWEVIRSFHSLLNSTSVKVKVEFDFDSKGKPVNIVVVDPVSREFEEAFLKLFNAYEYQLTAVDGRALEPTKGNFIVYDVYSYMHSQCEKSVWN